MSTPRKIVNGDGSVSWQARYRDPEGKQRKRNFALKRDADAFLDSARSSVRSGSYVDTANRTTLAEYASTYLDARATVANTDRTYRQRIDTHVTRQPIGSRRLVEIRPSEVQAWATGRSKVLAPSTTAELLKIVGRIFASAVLDGLIGKSPFVRITVPSGKPDKVIPPTVDQVDQLATHAAARHRAMVRLQAATGLRISELAGLRLADVDFLRRTVTVSGQIEAGTRLRVDYGKTAAALRTVDLPDESADALAAHLARWPARDDGLIFTTQRGTAYDVSAYSASFKRAAVKAGLPDTTSHDLRHHFASVQLAARVTPEQVAELLGHEDASLVYKVYGHLIPGNDGITPRQAIDNAWRAYRQSQPTGLRAVQ